MVFITCDNATHETIDRAISAAFQAVLGYSPTSNALVQKEEARAAFDAQVRDLMGRNMNRFEIARALGGAHQPHVISAMARVNKARKHPQEASNGSR